MSSAEPARPRLSDLLRRRTTSGAFFPEIDGLRFLAIAPVVLQHLAERLLRALELGGGISNFDRYIASLMPTGSLGVELFFVISGYIICLPLARRAAAAPDKRPEFHYGFYMLRRLTRLEPPYLLVLGLSLAAVTCAGSLGLNFLTEGTKAYSASSISLSQSAAASAVYMHGVLFRAQPRLNPPAWSLEIEFQFYILAPAIILFALAIGRLLRSFAAEVMTLIAIVFGAKYFAVTYIPNNLAQYLVVNYIEFFVLGFILSRLFARGFFRHPVVSKLATPLFLGGIVLAWYADHIANLREVTSNLLIVFLLLVSFAAVFTGALSGGVGRRFTSSTWIWVIGGMCYSIYLLHLLFLQTSTRVLIRLIPVHDLLSGAVIYGVILIPLLLVCCAIFFLLVEKPCMNPQWPRLIIRGVRRLFLGEEPIAAQGPDSPTSST